MDLGKFKNYEIEVDMRSLQSNEGQNSGHLGIVFNYLDQLNYDFVYLELHETLIPDPPPLSNKTPSFTSGYRLNGELFFDERVVLNKSIPSNIFHSIRIVIDSASI